MNVNLINTKRRVTFIFYFYSAEFNVFAKSYIILDFSPTWKSKCSVLCISGSINYSHPHDCISPFRVLYLENDYAL